MTESLPNSYLEKEKKNSSRRREEKKGTEWWSEAIHKRSGERKAVASLAMMVSWKVWMERNARVFRNNSTTATMVIAKIKEEANRWCLAGGKALCNLMPRE